GGGGHGSQCAERAQQPRPFSTPRAASPRSPRSLEPQAIRPESNAYNSSINLDFSPGLEHKGPHECGPGTLESVRHVARALSRKWVWPRHGLLCDPLRLCVPTGAASRLRDANLNAEAQRVAQDAEDGCPRTTCSSVVARPRRTVTLACRVETRLGARS